MSKVLVIARHEYKVNVRRKGFLFITALVPAVGALLLFVAAFFGGQAEGVLQAAFAGLDKPVGVVDNDGRFSRIADAEAEQFVAIDSEEEGRALVQAEELSALFVIPDDYLQTGEVTVFTRGGAFAAAMLEDSGRVRRFFVSRLVPDDVAADVRVRVEDPFRPRVVDLSQPEEEATGSDLEFVVNLIMPFALSLLLVSTIFVASGYLLRSVSEEKTSRVIEIMLSSVTPRQLLAGKVVGLGALGLTQVVVWLGAAVVLSGGIVALLGVAVPLLSRPEVLWLSLIYYALGFLLYAVAMGSVGALGTTMQESQQLAGVFSLAAAVPLMLSGLLFSNPNILVARVLSWFPLTAPTMMLVRLGVGEVPPVDVVGSILVLLVSIPIVLWVGAKVFRMGLLMYGKRPGARQVLRSLREA